VPAISEPSLPATIAPAAPPRPDEGPTTAVALGKEVFQEACVSCHDWSGISAISPYATIAGARAVNDPKATNVAQIVISGTRRLTPKGIVSMPAFGAAYSDTEIAAVANYVTARFGSEPSKVTEKNVTDLRSQTAQ
jgi:mono/diheme cytochrome c family protein